jgi:YHS domain-containing protein
MIKEKGEMMKVTSFIVLFLISLFVLSGNTYSQDEIKKGKNAAKSEQAEELNTICPVSTEPADPEITYMYEGKTYSVCCNSCLKKFKKDPEKYISRLSEDGKSIVKSKKEVQ